MIGSVHGCVSCPVVVKPWEPQPLSHPQHPLPSHPHVHTYSLQTRSSSVHPWPQNASSDYKTQRSSLTSQKLTKVQSLQSDHQYHFDISENEFSTEKCGFPEKTQSANGSPKKTASPKDSTAETETFYKTQRDFATEIEKLLQPKENKTSDADIAVQNTLHSQPSNTSDQKSHDFNKGIYYVESCAKASEIISSPSHSVKISKQQELSSDQNAANFDRTSKDQWECQKENAPTKPYLLNVSKLESPSFNRMGITTAPLPSIQSAWKMSTKGEPAQGLLGSIPLLTSLRPCKGLPSISNPKFQKIHSGVPPPSKPSLTLDHKRQPTEYGKYENKIPRKFKHPEESFHYTKLRRKKDQQPASTFLTRTNLHGLSSETKESKTVDTPNAFSNKASESSLKSIQDTASSQNVFSTKYSVALPVQPVRDISTPQSLDSSNWSLGMTAVAPEVDALTTAAAAGDMLKIKSLLAEGVDVNATNTFGRCAIQVMTHDNTDLAEMLLKSGADPNIQDKGRKAAYSTFRTIAHDVAASGYTDMLRCLLRHGADVNLQDRWGNTPLHLAAKGGHLEAVQLLRRGTSLHQPNYQGKTPIMLLEESGNSTAKQWAEIKMTTVSHLQTLCVLAVRKELGPHGLRCWRKHAPEVYLQCQVLLQRQNSQQASASTLRSSRHSAAPWSLATKGHDSGNGSVALGILIGKQIADFLSLRDLMPRRLSTGENTSLEVQNTSSGHSNDDISVGAQATSSLASETGSLFETNLSSIDSADDISLISPDRSL